MGGNGVTPAIESLAYVPHMTARRAFVSGIAAMATACAIIVAAGISCAWASDEAAAVGLRKDVVFTDYTPLSANAELIRRMLSPLAAAQLPAVEAQMDVRLSRQPVDLAREKFVLYVPPRAPKKGYGLLVFVAPWDDAALPPDWVPVLDQFGLILVEPVRSGNDQSLLGRRYPLALLAEYNVAQRYRLDPDRIFVTGFSGGSRVALRLALAYPDIFRGAILNAGSDPIGDRDTPLPPADLFHRFQEAGHLVYVTGDRDIKNMSFDHASMHSLDSWCVFNVDFYAELSVAHDVMDPGVLARALGLLSTPAHPDPARLAACRNGNEAELAGQFAEAESLLAQEKRDDARRKLIDIDARFGGLAAPRSLTLFDRLGGN